MRSVLERFPRAPSWRRELAVLAAASFLSCASAERGRYAVTAVEVEGAEKMAEEALEACLVTQEREWAELRLGLSAPVCNEPPFDSSAPTLRLWRWPWTDWPSFNRAVLDRDVERILRWYRARGFYDARVEDIRFDPPEAAEPGAVGTCDRENELCPVEIVIVVREGKPVRVRAVALEGLEGLGDAVESEASGAIAFQKGGRFDEVLHDQNKERIREVLRAASYAAAEVEGHVEVDTGTRTADVTYRALPGPLYRFGKLTVVGHGTLPRGKIEKAAGLTEGEPFDPEVLKEIQAEVFALGAFSAVEVRETLDKRRRRVDLTVKVSPLAPQQLRVGVGVLSGATRRTETGEHTSVPQWDLHLFGTYEKRYVFGSLGRLRIDERPRMIFGREFPRTTEPSFGNVLGVRLNEPGLIEARTDSFVRAEWDYGPDAFLGFRRSDIYVRAGSRRGFLTHRLVVTLAAQQDLFLVPTDGNTTSDGSPTPSAYGYSFVEEDVRVDLRDDRVRATRGVYLALNATQAPRWRGSDFAAFRVSPEVRGYVPLPLDAVLAARFATAAMFIVSSSPDLDALSRRLGPSSYRLRGGGATSNRGFLPGTLGAGIQGGLRRWESTLELRIPVGASLALVGFGDVGDVNDAPSFRFSHLNTSVGFGIWYYTIIGAIRLDAGFRIAAAQRADGSDGIENDASTFPLTSAPGALHLTIGESF